jgi:ribonuclease P protein component
VLHYLLLDHELARFGLVVSRKVGNAVVRNKVKRWLREAVWHAEEAMPPVDLVLRARPSAAQSEFDEIAQDIRAGMRKIGAPQ